MPWKHDVTDASLISRLGSAQALLELSSPPWKGRTARPVEGGAGLEGANGSQVQRGQLRCLDLTLYNLGVLFVGVLLIRANTLWGVD